MCKQVHFPEDDDLPLTTYRDDGEMVLHSQGQGQVAHNMRLCD